MCYNQKLVCYKNITQCVRGHHTVILSSNMSIHTSHSCKIIIIGIKHDFPFINIPKVSREVLKTEGVARGFQLSRDLANVNE